jgi:hypothetical protein
MWEIQVKLATAKSVCTWKYRGSSIRAFIHGIIFLTSYSQTADIRVAQVLSQPGVLLLVVKRLGNGFDRSPPSPTKFKN